MGAIGVEAANGLAPDGSWEDGEAADVAVLAVPGAHVGVVTAPDDALPVSRSRGLRVRWTAAVLVLTFIFDVVAILAAYVVAKAIRADWEIGPGLLHRVDTAIFLTVPVWPVVFAMYGLYDLRRATHITAEIRRLFHAVALCVLIVVLFAFATRIDLSRSFIAALLVFSLVSTALGRLAVRRLTHALNARAITSQATIIAGCNDEGRAIARTLGRRRWMGYDVRGFIDVTHSGVETVDGLPVLGGIDDIGEVAASHGARVVIVAGSAVAGGMLQQIDTSLAEYDLTVRVSPGLPNLGASRVVVEPIDGMALFSLRRHNFSRRQRLQKRVLDVVLASAMLIVAAPIMVVIALLVRVTSPGPALFRQGRVGAAGRVFTMYKFRTMVANAEEQRTDLHVHNEADGPLFKIREDPRITRVGRVLRRFSLDELPQLLNVLLGNMSLVGPRPALPEETARYDERWLGRLRVKPGLTGLWQVNGRHDLVFDDYVRYDLFYVENWSLTMDLYIIAKTLPALIAARGSY